MENLTNFSGIALLAAAIFYLAAFLVSLSFIFRGDPGKLPQFTRRFLLLGLVAQGLSFAAEARVSGLVLPVLSFSGALNFFALSIVVIYFLLGLKREIRTFSLVASPVLFMLLLMSFIGYSISAKPFDYKMTLPFVIHIVATFFAYGAFFVSFTSSIFYLVQSDLLKRKRSDSIFYKLPSLETLHEIINETIDWGFVLLTLGMVIAGLWLFKLEGAISEWHTGGKLFLSLLVWAIYLTIMITKGLGFAKGKNAALLSLGAFSFTMLAFLGARLTGTF